MADYNTTLKLPADPEAADAFIAKCGDSVADHPGFCGQGVENIDDDGEQRDFA